MTVVDERIKAIQEAIAAGQLAPHLEEKEQLTLWSYTKYLVNILEEEGFTLRGHTFKYDVPMCLLVVKVWREREGLVTFINDFDIIKCMCSFLRKLGEGRVDWQKDKFA